MAAQPKQMAISKKQIEFKTSSEEKVSNTNQLQKQNINSNEPLVSNNLSLSHHQSLQTERQHIPSSQIAMVQTKNVGVSHDFSQDYEPQRLPQLQQQQELQVFRQHEKQIQLFENLVQSQMIQQRKQNQLYISKMVDINKPVIQVHQSLIIKPAIQIHQSLAQLKQGLILIKESLIQVKESLIQVKQENNQPLSQRIQYLPFQQSQQYISEQFRRIIKLPQNPSSQQPISFWGQIIKVKQNVFYFKLDYDSNQIVQVVLEQGKVKEWDRCYFMEIQGYLHHHNQVKVKNWTKLDDYTNLDAHCQLFRHQQLLNTKLNHINEKKMINLILKKNSLMR